MQKNEIAMPVIHSGVYCTYVKQLYLSCTFCKVSHLSNVKNTVKNVNNFAVKFQISIKNRKDFHFTAENDAKTEIKVKNRREYFLQGNA